MIRYRATLSNRLHPEQREADDGRVSDFYTYWFEFCLVPVDKVGRPDEARCTKRRRIKVEADGDDMDAIKRDHPQLPDAADRMLYWFALNALEQGQEDTKLDLDSPLVKAELSRIDPNGPFALDLPSPAMGFHAGR